MIRMCFRILVTIIPLLVIMFTCWINIGIHFRSNSYDAEQLTRQLNYIGRVIDDGADKDMQSLYPEGYMFINSLYGLAWCDRLAHNADERTRLRGQEEVARSLRRVESDQARSIFYEDLLLPYGAFYNGWTTYLLGKKLEVCQPDTTGISRFRQKCQRIAVAIEREVYPESYLGMAWPADAVVCVAALALHDRLFEPRYGPTIIRWKQRVASNLDPRGLIPHSARPSGAPLEHARGSSQCLMLALLKDVDSAFARQQFILFSRNFVDSRFGMIGIREYPREVVGLGDVDSGPVILGMGGAATIVGIRTLNAYGDKRVAALRHAVEALTLSIENDSEKRYLLGALPIADAFITWSYADLPDTVYDEAFHFTTFTIVSMITLLVCAAWIYWLWRY